MLWRRKPERHGRAVKGAGDEHVNEGGSSQGLQSAREKGYHPLAANVELSAGNGSG